MLIDKTLHSKTVSVKGASLTFQSQTIGVNHRFGEIVWSRPVAVLVERDEVHNRIPIVDVTRVALWFLWGLNFVFSVNLVTGFIRRRRGKDE